LFRLYGTDVMPSVVGRRSPPRWSRKAGQARR
jgi:hypothetical protein